MKILLINSPVFNDIGRVLAESPPLALLYLAGFVERSGYPDIKIVDADALEMTWSDLENLFLKEKPDIIGVTGPSFVLPALFKTVAIARRALPDCKIVTGGFGSTKEPKKVLEAAGRAVDFVVMGEGEITFVELIKRIENGGNFNDIDGLSYLENGSLITTKPREYIKDLNALPWPAYHLMEPSSSRYSGMHAKYKEMKLPNSVMLASRGCPHRCTFCSLGSKMFRQRDPKDIVDEMEYYHNQFGARSIQVYDDEFIGLSPKQNEWIKEICHHIIQRGLNKKISFLVQGRCSPFVEFEILKIMRTAGFVWIWWGVESGSQKVLDLVKKDIKVENVIRDFALARRAGIKSMMFIMVGFPGETPDDVRLTARLIKKVNPDHVRIHIPSPYPGSELRTYLEENNLLDTDDYYKFDTRNNIVYHTNEMTPEEIKKYYRMLVFRFENGYWYFIKFGIKSLTTADGWKKLFKRIKMAISYFWNWAKVGFD